MKDLESVFEVPVNFAEDLQTQFVRQILHDFFEILVVLLGVNGFHAQYFLEFFVELRR